MSPRRQLPMQRRAVEWGAQPQRKAEEKVSQKVQPDGLRWEQLVTLETNIDDMSSQLIPYVMDKLLHAGALDTWCLQAIMKKGRPGLVLNVLCRAADVTRLTRIILLETTTLGVRVRGCERGSVERVMESAPTPWGFVPVKAAYLNGALVTAHAEYEDCAALARQHNVPLKEVFDAAHRSYYESEQQERRALGL